MQSGSIKITLPIMGLLFSLTIAHAQEPSRQLAKADSLFTLKKYTQSQELYTALYNQQRYTPAMLLRMAFIEEGLSRYADALYYLNQYYNKTFDEAALIKIRELAAAHQLKGYDHSDINMLATAWRRYGYTVTLALAIPAILLTIIMLVISRGNPVKTSVWIAQSVFLLLLLIHINYPFDKKAVIRNSPTFLMSGPSAGASVAAKISEGHRVTVTGRQDVWLMVEWEEKKVFVRESNVRLLQF